MSSMGYPANSQFVSVTSTVYSTGTMTLDRQVTDEFHTAQDTTSDMDPGVLSAAFSLLLDF